MSLIIFIALTFVGASSAAIASDQSDECGNILNFSDYARKNPRSIFVEATKHAEGVEKKLAAQAATTIAEDSDTIELLQKDLSNLDYELSKHERHPLRERLKRVYLEMASRYLSRLVQEGMAMAQKGSLMNSEEKEALRRLNYYLAPLANGTGRVETDFMQMMIQSAPSYHPSFAPTMSKVFFEVRYAHAFFEEALESTVTRLSIADRAKLRTLAVSPTRPEIEQRLDAVEEALRAGDARLSWCLLSKINEAFAVYRVIFEILNDGILPGIHSIDGLYVNLVVNGPASERFLNLSRKDSDFLVERIDSLIPQVRYARFLQQFDQAKEENGYGTLGQRVAIARGILDDYSDLATEEQIQFLKKLIQAYEPK